jgi:hypothetical protein
LLEHTDDVLVPLGGEDAEIGLRVPPRTVMMRGRAGNQEGHEVHLTPMFHGG